MSVSTNSYLRLVDSDSGAYGWSVVILSIDVGVDLSMVQDRKGGNESGVSASILAFRCFPAPCRLLVYCF